MHAEHGDHKVDLKQRMVGAIVIVSLAIIILPVFFSPTDDSLKHFKVEKVPPIPREIQDAFIAKDKNLKQSNKMPVLPIPKSIPVDNENEKQALTTNIDKTSHVSNYKNAKKPKDKTINQKYTLQLGSFGQQENAFNLRNKLRNKKFKAYIEQIKIDKKINYRVRVGPYLKYEQMVSIQKKIKKSFKIDGRIISL
jgi:cell division septation protein DedD